MGRCALCGDESPEIASALSLCAPCIRERPDRARPIALDAHSRSRARFGLPPAPPRGGAVKCTACANRCEIAEGTSGYCALRAAREGKLATLAGTPVAGALRFYHDPLPTNCVAQWVCPGGSGAGYPRFAHAPGPEFGFKNLAVFYAACSFDCLFCQNWHYRLMDVRRGTCSAEELARAVDEKTSCICYFGGDPVVQLPHALEASRLALRRAGGRILRICWETNGAGSRGAIEAMLGLSLDSGGSLKFDLKCWSEALHIALCGVPNRATLENFAFAVESAKRRREPPPVVASTLLVPGYVDADEVRAIARFIAGLDPATPYALLGFHSDCEMRDLGATSRAQAARCLEAARSEGLTRVRVGNLHLLR